MSKIVQFKSRSDGNKANKRKREEYDADNEFRNGKTNASISGQSSRIDIEEKPLQSGNTIAVRYESHRDAAPMQHAGDAKNTSADLDEPIKGDKLEKTATKEDALKAAAGSTSKKGGVQGPIRASGFIRTTTCFDYQPDICKDYKETGFCGYGDSCKFLHDRGDYKSGWQQGKEWDEQQAKAKLAKAMRELTDDPLDELLGGDDADARVDYSVDLGDELPFACLLCREDFVNPVVTVCGHYFCSACIVKHQKKSLKCPAPACGKETFGVLNKAHNLVKKLAASAVATSSVQVKRKTGQWEVLDE